MGSTAPDERQTAIIQAVWQVIAEKGMSAVSMRNVAAAAGVSVGRIQYWFPSKDELLRASLEVMLTSAAQLHAAATERADDREKLWQLIGQPIPRAETSSAGVSVFYQYVAAGTNHPILARMLTEAKDGAESEAARLLGRIAPGLSDPRTTARSLIATADGLTMRVLIGSLSAAEAEQALRIEVNRATSPRPEPKQQTEPRA
ncbi:TetR/AcrR family transcriptional regulator [Nocardia donostiensis]|uniref:TetR family transcriptional regulator n=1 Tax=Nocardia donostiensis TaxID=1538463 RepID=A0A1W0B2Q0_9NOCA|nr:TetR/AcrR family transcriptional regulator [Nocardia donostiensis]ONM48603.1 TetR family transcriptional regulator [Nocardia donostiensis]OQS16792.1 TetR family transcriptional regulator [Nocardia donostiensis]OQS23257.1 TetR family transcriptional regulator [Nocardia donostiensis]